MFDRDEFLVSCLGALSEGTRAAVAVKELLERTAARPSEIEAAVGDVTAISPFTVWHRSPELTVLHVVWPPGVELLAHDHRMWAAIGLYGGREDNRFFVRRPDGGLDVRGKGVTLRAGDAVALGADTVHAVANPSQDWTGSIHVYGGDYFAAERAMWPDPESGAVAFDAAVVAEVLTAAAAAARG
jgi:predicted metal-dependent enzyme (double-stranded beta helix superfamily)